MQAKDIEERYRCNVCGNEVIVTKAGGGELYCCGRPMEQIIEALWINKKQLTAARMAMLMLVLISFYGIFAIPVYAYALKVMFYCAVIVLIISGIAIYNLRNKKK